MIKADIGIVEKLERQADQTSGIYREMAEAKSLRQESNTERRTDLYMWPTPEQTTEGQAAAIIMEMVEALTPSAETKAAYMGEFSFETEGVDEAGNPMSVRLDVPWTTVKEIMAAIRTRAKVSGK